MRLEPAGRKRFLSLDHHERRESASVIAGTSSETSPRRSLYVYATSTIRRPQTNGDAVRETFGRESVRIFRGSAGRDRGGVAGDDDLFSVDGPEWVRVKVHESNIFSRFRATLCLPACLLRVISSLAREYVTPP